MFLGRSDSKQLNNAAGAGLALGAPARTGLLGETNKLDGMSASMLTPPITKSCTLLLDVRILLRLFLVSWHT